MSKYISKFIIVVGVLGVLGLAMIFLTPTQGNVLAADPTGTPGTPVAPAPTPTPIPFTAKIDVVAMYPAMGEINPDTGRPTGILAPRGDDSTKTYAVSGPGSKNVPPGVPVYVQAGAISLAEGAKLKDYTWTLKGPSGSAAAIAKVEKAVPGLSLDMATFTPDKEGEYVVGLIVTDDKGAKSAAGELKIVAAKYVGNETCKGCHPEQYENWSKTLHGHAFKSFVNENAEGEYFSVGFNCARCHTVGYYPVKESTGGWWDTFVNVLKLDWNKDLKDKIATNAFNEEEGKDTFSGLDPKLQAVSNIGCESCHGPGGAHVVKPGLDTAPSVSENSGVCDQCHNASGHHTRGGAFDASAHARAYEVEGGVPANNPGCARCHSGAGYVSSYAEGFDPAKATTGTSEIGCPVCHDPHSDANAYQLRKVGQVVSPTVPEPFTIENAGLSAVCMDCHNARREGKIVEDPKAARFAPHASTATELVNGFGGYDFGFKLQNSGHVNIGKGVVADEGATLFDGQNPGACVVCHMYITPGGVWDTTDSLAVPGHNKVGGHTFAMVSEVNGKEVEHTEACQQCHSGITTFNFTANADYDGDGKAEGVQDEINGLRELLKKVILAWKDANSKSITLDKEGAFVTQDIQLTTEIKAAIYNLAFVNGNAATAHNFYRSVGLLQASIEKVTGKPLAKATLLYGK